MNTVHALAETKLHLCLVDDPEHGVFSQEELVWLARVVHNLVDATVPPQPLRVRVTGELPAPRRVLSPGDVVLNNLQQNTTLPKVV